MPYLDLKTKLEPSRAIKNKLLQLGVYSCFVMVFLFMLGIFSATVYQGIGAFKTTKIYLTIDHVQGRSVRSNLIQALYKEFPSYSLRQEKKQIRKLVSDNAYYLNLRCIPMLDGIYCESLYADFMKRKV